MGVDLTAQAYIYDPELDRVVPAGEAMVSGYNGCVLLPDGRVLLVPCSATSPLIYDPRADTMTVSAAVTPAELQTGTDFPGGVAAAGRAGAAGADAGAERADLRPGGGQPGGRRRWTWAGSSCGGGVLLADGRVLLAISYGAGRR